MKRKIGIAAAIILALFVVTGCQKQEETPKKSEQKKTEASEELLSGTHHAENPGQRLWNDYSGIRCGYSTDHCNQFCESCKRRIL